jgi:chromate transporter
VNRAAAGLPGYFLRLGLLGFGGPAALTAAMQRDLVEGSAILSEQEFRRGVALAQICPGPLAAQLCFYIGFIRGGVVGALLAGLAFVLPGFAIVVATGRLYQTYGGLPGIQAAFYGVAAAVSGLIARSALRLFRRSVGRDPLLILLGTSTTIVTAASGREYVWLVLGCGTTFWLARRPPAPATVLEGASLLLLFGAFAYAGTFVLGSGLAIVPFLHGTLVRESGGLTERQFADAVAIALLSPGPVVIGTAFMGYLLAGFPGAAVAAAGTFLPSFLLTVILARPFSRSAARPGLTLWVSGVTASTMGALAGTVLLLIRQAVRDPATATIAAVAVLAAARGRVPEPLVVLLAGALGVLLAR